MTRRRKRGERLPQDKRPRITELDPLILEFIGRAGVAELPQIATVFYSSTPAGRVAAARRLRRLTDAGLISTWVVSLDRTNRYTLTPKGAELVPQPPSAGLVLRVRLNGRSSIAEHLIASAAIWSALIVRLRGREPRLLRQFTEGELRRAGAGRGALVPDAITALRMGSATIAIAWEIDLDHESPRVLSAKMTKYARHLVGGEPLFGLRLATAIVVVPTAERALRMARIIGRTQIASHVFVQALDRLSSQTVLEELATAESLQTLPIERAFTERLLPRSST